MSYETEHPKSPYRPSTRAEMLAYYRRFIYATLGMGKPDFSEMMRSRAYEWSNRARDLGIFWARELLARAGQREEEP